MATVLAEHLAAGLVEQPERRVERGREHALLVVRQRHVADRHAQRVARDLAWPADAMHTIEYMTEPSALLIKNFPEFRCYRDIAFYCKLFLNPDIRRFPPKNRWVQRDAELTLDDGAPLRCREGLDIILQLRQPRKVWRREQVRAGGECLPDLDEGGAEVSE